MASSIIIFYKSVYKLGTANASGWKKAAPGDGPRGTSPERRFCARRRPCCAGAGWARTCAGGDGAPGGWTSGKGARRTQHGVQHLLGSPADQPARPGAARGGASPFQPLPNPRLPPPPLSRPRLSASSSGPTAAPPRGLPGPPPRAAPPHGLPGPPPRARPAWPSSRPCCSVSSVPLLLHPAVLTLSPSFPQRMSSFQLNINPLKEPLGFIKVLEWVSAARTSEAWNRAAVTVTAPAPAPARPAPSAGRPGAPAGARAGTSDPARVPETAAAALGRVGTAGRGREAAGWACAGRGRRGPRRITSPSAASVPAEAPLPHAGSPLGAPAGVGVQVSLWLHGFPQGKRKLPVAV